MGVDRAFNAMRLLARYLVLSLVGLTTIVALGGEPTRHVSLVVKLTHLAVILPELQEVRDDWDCELWTPTVEQAAAAEKAILQRIKELAKDGVKFDVNARYIIQYYGVVLEKRNGSSVQLSISGHCESLVIREMP